MDTKKDTKIYSRLLLDWYYAERRILPWREDPTPYHVWISEIMLQQTRVEAVKEYYRRFLEALPDVRALAEAEESEYMKLWEGLGYYSRVRNMHKAAVVIMEEHGGQIPGTSQELEKLPGIGSYTAAAIASIAFGEPVPSVDGNLLRVFARMTCSGQNILDGSTKKLAEAWYQERISREAPGDFNQAVMDLGATVCLPNTAPLCLLCPWAELCESHAAGRELEFPVRIKKTKKKVGKNDSVPDRGRTEDRFAQKAGNRAAGRTVRISERAGAFGRAGSQGAIDGLWPADRRHEKTAGGKTSFFPCDLADGRLSGRGSSGRSGRRGDSGWRAERRGIFRRAGVLFRGTEP